MRDGEDGREWPCERVLEMGERPKLATPRGLNVWWKQKEIERVEGLERG